MTRFLLISDTHLGGGDTGYKAQPKYADRLPGILAALTTWIEENGPVDFTLHAGDIIHETSDENIAEAVARFDAFAPLHLCLGNHDLTRPDCLGHWLERAPRFFGNGSPNYAVETPDGVVHVIPNHYEETPWYWESGSNAHFKPGQVRELDERLATHAGKRNFILTHSPVLAVPPDQIGSQKPFHTPPDEFTACLTEIAERHDVACVLGGHSHVNMHAVRNGVHYVTVSSLVETPFEFKCFDVGDGVVRMRTVSLADRVTFDWSYDFEKTFAQGRACDRTFEQPRT